MAERKTRKLKKKSETLEVRLDHETKQAFIETCRENGTTASDVVRSAIDRYLARNKRHSGRPTPEANDGVSAMIVPFVMRRKRVLAGGVGAVALGALVALPSAAGPDVRATFDRLDANGDGVLSADEFMPSMEGDASRTAIIRIERSEESPDLDGETAGERGEAYAYWIPSGDEEGDVTEVVRSHEVRVVRSVDGDGLSEVSEPEDVVALFSKIRQESFSAFDLNGDGQVSFMEYDRRHREMLEDGFHRLDTDKDGQLTKAEYTAAPVIELRAARAEAAEQDGHKHVEFRVEHGDHAGMKTPDRGAAYDKLDANGDGRLTLQEYMPTT